MIQRYVCIRLTPGSLVIRSGRRFWVYPLPTSAQLWDYGLIVCPVRKPRLP